MTTQYGFFIVPAAVLAVKPANWRAKILKILARKSVSAVFMNMLAATGRKIMASGTRTCSLIISPSPVTIAMTPHVQKSAPAAQCISVKMALWWFDEDVCIGCRYCHMACPYGAPQYNAEKGHMTKWHGCYSRVAEGKQPICVESCPLRALEFGPIEELRQKHGTLAAVAPLRARHFTKPNIVIKPNANSRPTGDTTGYLANPEEV
ncbi:anaerobic dimethyl sulfoxide reductase subunit B [Escherichia coli]|uniref:Anaerobic dimethyl sulfoxide reductase subunit B n=1 Tax=Escherichia coli TaxID=562 RepID=A0A376S716_ECOLX|nr:anaerobic dimethyl sulfoxide reductase subunit B [Escherichia coli]